MQRIAVIALMVLASFLSIGSVNHLDIAAQESTPVASPKSGGLAAPPVVGAPIAAPADACDPTAFPAGTTGVAYRPLEDYGFVVPADEPDHNLYLTEDTLPPGTCFLFDRGTFGASTFLVQEGTLQFIAWGGRTNIDPVVMAGDEDGHAVTVPLGAPVTLESGDWVTIDRAIEAYAYRNSGTTNGRIVMAVSEMTGPRDGCVSGCRRHP